jgi:hypothetical protein
MTRDEILKKAREQRSGGAEGGAVLDAASLANVQAKAKAQRGAVEAPEVKAPSAAPAEQPSALSRGAKKAAMGIMGPAGSILEMTGLDKSLVGAGETALSMGSGIVGQALGGLAGLGSAALNGADAGAETVKDVQEALTYTPRTEKGQEYMGNVGSVMEPVGEVLTATSEALGDTAYNVTGSPLIASAFYTLPDAAMEVAGLGLAGKTARTARLAKQSNEIKAATELLEDPLNRVADPTGAQWKLDKDGVAVPNTDGRALVESGIMGGSQAALVTNSNKATKVQMEAMTKAFNDQAINKPTTTPAQIIGQNAGKALKEVNDVRKGLGQKMDDMVKGEVGATRVDATPALNNFYRTLDEMGVGVKNNPNTRKFELDFRDSQLDYKSFAGARSLLEDGFQMTAGKGPMTLSRVHKMKKQLDNLLDAKKLEQGGELGNIERKLLELRSGLNDAARQVPEYRAINEQYSAIVDGLSNFDSFRPAGKSWDSPRVMNNVGAAMKSAAADTAKVNNMLEGLSSLNSTLSSIGAKPFTVDVAGLARYNDFLNSNFSRSVIESTPRGGFLRSSRQNVQGAALSAMVGNKFGVANNVSGLVANGIDAKVAAEAARKAKANQALVLRALKN